MATKEEEIKKLTRNELLEKLTDSINVVITKASAKFEPPLKRKEVSTIFDSLLK